MTNSLYPCLLAITSLLLIGCAAPGSVLTRSSIHGKLLDRRGQPVSGQRVEVLLPSSYGLEGMDRIQGQPEDYGHHDETVVLRTDRNGEFRHLFEARTRSIMYFLLPPIGPVPRQAPKPSLQIRTPRHNYLVGWNRDHFDYRIAPSPKPAKQAGAPGEVSGSYALRKPGEGQGVDGWETSVEIRE